MRTLICGLVILMGLGAQLGGRCACQTQPGCEASANPPCPCCRAESVETPLHSCCAASAHPALPSSCHQPALAKTQPTLMPNALAWTRVCHCRLHIPVSSPIAVTPPERCGGTFMAEGLWTSAMDIWPESGSASALIAPAKRAGPASFLMNCVFLC